MTFSVKLIKRSPSIRHKVNEPRQTKTFHYVYLPQQSNEKSRALN